MIGREDFLAALGEPDEGFNRALDAALWRISAEEARPVMKKKLSYLKIISKIIIMMF